MVRDIDSEFLWSVDRISALTVSILWLCSDCRFVCSLWFLTFKCRELPIRHSFFGNWLTCWTMFLVGSNTCFGLFCNFRVWLKYGLSWLLLENHYSFLLFMTAIGGGGEFCAVRVSFLIRFVVIWLVEYRRLVGPREFTWPILGAFITICFFFADI